MTNTKTASSAWASFLSFPPSYHLEKLINRGYHHVEVGEQKISLSPRQRGIIGNINRFCHPFAFLRRRAIAKEIIRDAPSDLRLKNSFVRAKIASTDDKIRTVCEGQIELYQDFLDRGDEALIAANVDPKVYRREMQSTTADPLKHIPFRYDAEVLTEVVRFCAQPRFIAMAAQYLGVMPVLGTTLMLYSANSDPKLRRAQRFHIDPEGRRQVKLFMAIRPVREQDGPLTFVPGDRSRAMLDSGDTRYQESRVDDSAIEEYCPKSEWVIHTGSFGEAVFVDTSNCFHFGSRPSKKPQPRILLHATYLDPLCSVFPVKDPLGRHSKRYTHIPDNVCENADYILARKL